MVYLRSKFDMIDILTFLTVHCYTTQSSAVPTSLRPVGSMPLIFTLVSPEAICQRSGRCASRTAAPRMLESVILQNPRKTASARRLER